MARMGHPPELWFVLTLSGPPVVSSCEVGSLSDFFADGGSCGVRRTFADRISWTDPAGDCLSKQPQDGSPVLERDSQPRQFGQHRKVNSAETEARQKDIDAISKLL